MYFIFVSIPCHSTTSKRALKTPYVHKREKKKANSETTPFRERNCNNQQKQQDTERRFKVDADRKDHADDPNNAKKSRE